MPLHETDPVLVNSNKSSVSIPIQLNDEGNLVLVILTLPQHLHSYIEENWESFALVLMNTPHETDHMSTM